MRYICTKGVQAGNISIGKGQRITERPKALSKKEDYGFALTARAVDINDVDSEQVYKVGITPRYNYDRRAAVSLTNYRRRFRNNIVRKFLENTYNSGVEPKRARSIVFKEFCTYNAKGNILIIEDLYNESARIRYADMLLKIPVEVVFEMLDDNFYYMYKAAADSSLTYLFFTSLEICDILRDNPFALVIDCIYRTIKYGLPLFVIVAVTSLGITILVAYVYLENERQPDFAQALKAFLSIMNIYDICAPEVIFYDRDQALISALEEQCSGIPTMLCRQHIDSDVKAYTMSVIGYTPNAGGQSNLTDEGRKQMQFYYNVINSRSEQAYEEELKKIKDEADQIFYYQADDRLVVIYNYLLDIQLTDYKKLYVKAQTNDIMHFGIDTTLPIESVYACLKSWLRLLRSNIVTFLRMLKLFFKHHSQRYYAKLEQARNRASIALTKGASSRFYTQLIRLIPTKRLLVLKQQKERYKAQRKAKQDDDFEIPECTRVFIRTQGMPYAYKLRPYVDSSSNSPLTLASGKFYLYNKIPQPTHTVEGRNSKRLEEFRIRPRRAKHYAAAVYSTGTRETGTRRKATRLERINLDHLAIVPPSTIIANTQPTRLYLESTSVY